MILIYVEEISERLLYTFDFIFKERRIEYRLTNDNIFLKRHHYQNLIIRILILNTRYIFNPRPFYLTKILVFMGLTKVFLKEKSV